MMKNALKNTYAAGAAVTVLALCSPAIAQDLPEILSAETSTDETYLPDFSYAGYGFGVGEIPAVTNAIDVADFGAVPDDGKDDSVALKKALAAAHEAAGPVRVQMHAGRYILSEILWIEKSGIVLAGMGMGDGGTTLFMPRPLNQIDDGGALDEIRTYLEEEDKYERQPENNLDVLFSPYSWSAGFIWSRVPGGRHATYLKRLDRPITKIADIASGKRGSRVIEVADAGALSVGDVLQIHWHNRAGPDGPLIEEMYGNTDQKIGSRHWENPDRPLVRQATEIVAIDGNSVTIGDPLLINITADVPAYFAEWDHLTNVGLQDFSLEFPENPFYGHHNESGFNGVYFTGVYNGWIENVRIKDGDSGIITDDLANVTIKNIVTEGEHMAHYSVHVGNVHNVLIDNLSVFNPTIHTFSFNTLSTKSVYTNSTGWVQPTLDQHAGANHQNLYDNVTVHVTPDQKTADGIPMYDLYKAGGAGYWQPGHGRYNTQWNVNVIINGGVAADGPVVMQGGSEGPDARVIGMHGNRTITLDHTPAPYLESMNSRVDTVPSLYYYQLDQRKAD